MEKIEKVLLINPPYTFNTYLNIDRNAGTMQHPFISLASIAGSLNDICDVKILDFDISAGNHFKILANEIQNLDCGIVGITATTPVFPSLLEIAKRVKEINQSILVIVGGAHVTARPNDALNSEHIDIVAVGESDFFLRDFIISKDKLRLKGAYLKREGRIIFNGGSGLIENLDTLPYPEWRLYDLKRYKASRLIERNSPSGLLETSRGCPFACVYCNKNIFGNLWRKKSVGRVISEFQYMKKIGFKEIHIEDDGFSTDLKHAKDISLGLIDAQVGIPWTLLNGIRVDRVDKELLELLKEAGCYQVAFGIESGDEDVLSKANKGITLKQIENAVKLANKIGVETFGFFMLGLPGETKRSLQKTIDFAKKLPLTIAKFAITIPYPGTPMFEELDLQHKIFNKNWKDYLLHNNKTPIYNHPNLDWGTIQIYYKKAYRDFYLHPTQVFKHCLRAIKNKTLLEEMVYLFKTKWF